MLTLKEQASEIYDYRDDREQEAVRSAAKSDKVGRHYGVERNFQDYAHVNGHEMSEPYEDIAECINDYAQDIKAHERRDSRYRKDDEQKGMYDTHNGYGYTGCIIDAEAKQSEDPFRIGIIHLELFCKR